MIYTQDQVALAAIAEGRRLGITERGIVIGLATEKVESNYTVYANAKVPDSMGLPHDAVGSDGYSVGPWQQQVVKGANGWWWGDAKTCMDPTTSSTLFFQRLMKTTYNDTTYSPGHYAQLVQQSAFPDRYDQVMASAQALYDRLQGQDSTAPAVTTPSPFAEHNIIDGNCCQSRNGHAPRLIVLHTEEGNMLGQALDAWMDENEVSYHYAIDPTGVAWDLIDTDLASWSVLDANSYTINYVFAGSYAAWTRTQWLNNMNSLKQCAFLVAQDCKKYGIPPVIRVGNGSGGYSTLPNNNGVTDHKGITDGLHIGTHQDVGAGFPWDVFNSLLQQYFNGIEDDDMFTDADRALLQRVHFELTNPWNSASIYAAPNEIPAPGNTLVGVALAIDGMNHAITVEDLAVEGDADSIMRILRTAAGEGLYGEDARVQQRAEAALKKIPADIFAAYEAAQAK